MRRSEIVARLRTRAATMRELGATSLYLFGSAARDESVEGSDIDLFIDHAADARFSLIELVAMKQFLERELAAEIDITTRDSLHPLLKQRIELSAIRVF